MPLVAEQTFVALCREMPETALTSFVGALFEVRGRPSHRVGPRTLIIGNEEQTRVQIASRGQSLIAENIDLVVGPSEMDTDTEVLEYSTLHQHLNYAIDREQAAVLFNTHFELYDRDPAKTADKSETRELDETVVDETTGNNNREDGSTVAADGRERDAGEPSLFGLSAPTGVTWNGVASGLLMSFVIVGVVGAVALSTGGLFDSFARSEGTSIPNTTQHSTLKAPGPTSGIPPDNSERKEESATPVPVSERLLVSLPPGIARDGSLNSSRFADVNRRLLSNMSYRAVLTVQLIRRGQVIGTRTTIIHRTETSYRLLTSWTGEQIATRPQIADHSLYYANRNLSTPEGTEPQRQIPAEQFPSRALGNMLADYVSFKTVTVVGTQSSRRETLYRITAAGQPSRLSTPQRATLFVDGDGLVRYGRWISNRSRSPASHTIVSLRVVGPTETTVTEPPWVGKE